MKKKKFQAELVFGNFHIGSVMVDFKTSFGVVMHMS